MSYILKEFVKGISLRGVTSDVTDNIEGSLFHNSTDKRLKAFIDNAIREIVTNSQAQILTNKTIDYNLNTILNLPGGGGGGGVNTDLSNLTSPTAIPAGVDLTSSAVDTTPFRVRTTSSSTTSTANIFFASGQVDAGTGTSGRAVMYTGWNLSSGNTGVMEISSGIAMGAGSSGSLTYFTGKSGTGFSGSVFIGTGSVDNFQQGLNNETNTSSTGAIQINTGIIRNTASNNRTGTVFLGSGSSTSIAGSGQVTISSGAIGQTGTPGTGSSGTLTLQSGAVNGTGATGSSGQVNIFSGSASISTGNSGVVSLRSGIVNSGTSGSIFIDSGSSTGTGASGSLNLRTGNSSLGNSGNIFIETGNASSGTRGYLNLAAREIYLSSTNLSGSNTALIVNDSGMYARNSFLVSALSDSQQYIHLDVNNAQYPSLWVGGQTHTVSRFANIGAFSAISQNAGGIGFKGAQVQGTVDGTYKGGDVYLETTSASYFNDPAVNLSISSGDLYLQTRDAFVKGTSTNANSGNILIQTGTAFGSGTRGDLTINCRRMYSEGGNALLVSTLNRIIVSDGNIDLLNSSGTVYHHNITTNINLQFINGIPGKRFTVVVRNTTGSNLTVNFPTVKQKAGTIINTVTANTSSIFEFVNSSNEYYCISCINNMV